MAALFEAPGNVGGHSCYETDEDLTGGVQFGG
jgi:hypothetical protein